MVAHLCASFDGPLWQKWSVNVCSKVKQENLLHARAQTAINKSYGNFFFFYFYISLFLFFFLYQNWFAERNGICLCVRIVKSFLRFCIISKTLCEDFLEFTEIGGRKAVDKLISHFPEETFIFDKNFLQSAKRYCLSLLMIPNGDFFFFWKPPLKTFIGLKISVRATKAREKKGEGNKEILSASRKFFAINFPRATRIILRMINLEFRKIRWRVFYEPFRDNR